MPSTPISGMNSGAPALPTDLIPICRLGSPNQSASIALSDVGFQGARSQSSQSRSLNSAFQISATRDALAFYSVQITVTASISGGQNGDAIFETADDSGFTTNVATESIIGNGQTYTLAIALQGIAPNTGLLAGYVKAGRFARLRTVNNTGTPAFSYRAGREILL